MLEHALRYAGFRWHVFPVHGIVAGRCTCGADCGHAGKHPWCEHGFADATTDAAQVRRWWGEHPQANIGIATGPSGLLVVDVDVRPGHDGRETWDELARANGKAETLSCITGSGGAHHYYTTSRPIRSRAGGIAQGLDIRAQGGYVVAPPSTHLSGRTYEWDGAEFAPLELVEAPAWLLELCTRSSDVRPHEPEAEHLEAEKVAEIRAALAYVDPDPRDTWLKVGMALKSTGAGDQALGLWTEWARGSDKFNEAGQRRTWKSLRVSGGVTLSSLFGLAKGSGFVDPTPPPAFVAAPTQFVPQPFTLEPPPGVMREVYHHTLATAPCPQPTMALGAAIAFAGLILGRDYVAESGAHLNHYTLILAPTGSGKEHPRDVLSRLAEECDMGEYLGERVFSGQGVIQAMKKTAKRLYLFDEFGLTMQRQDPNHLTLVQVLLDIYGASNRVYRGFDYASPEQERTEIDRPSLSIFATSTGHSFFRAIQSGDILSGFVPRFLVLETQHRPLPSPPALELDPPESVTDWAEWMRLGHRKAFGDGNLATLKVAQDADASQLLQDFFREAHELADPGRGPRHLVWTRSALMAAKVATMAGCAACAPGASSPAAVKAEHMSWAIELVRSSTRRLEAIVDENVADSPYAQSLNELLAIFLGAGQRGWTDREIARGCDGQLKKWSKDERKRILEDLRASEDLVLVDMPPAMCGGAPRKAWVHRRFAAPIDTASESEAKK